MQTLPFVSEEDAVVCTMLAPTHTMKLREDVIAHLRSPFPNSWRCDSTVLLVNWDRADVFPSIANVQQWLMGLGYVVLPIYNTSV
jgi:hypothetical protein